MTQYQSEAELQSAVVDQARLCGWLVHHLTDARRSEPGIPDLLMARRGKVLLWECKTEKGKVSTERRIANRGKRSERVLPSQQDWIEASGARVIRPSDWPWIESELA